MHPDSLTAARVVLGLTQAELARVLGVNVRTPSRWETGATPIPSVVAKLVVAALMSSEVRRMLGIVEKEED